MRTVKQQLDPELYPDYEYPKMDIKSDKQFREMENESIDIEHISHWLDKFVPI